MCYHKLPEPGPFRFSCLKTMRTDQSFSDVNGQGSVKRQTKRKTKQRYRIWTVKERTRHRSNKCKQQEASSRQHPKRRLLCMGGDQL
ncbi:hypothetical protein AV530_006140 [Patagioenas fasciata monilis]|uniref:Uncharacterized protein n=1 Tax=Patagioenas fasciata monilis TaxID=372326 RepID=A0A1V4J8Y5_PATFA|nr:hypothetical protein AV530_006140 [Patagioenas fasciata monilis]